MTIPYHEKELNVKKKVIHIACTFTIIFKNKQRITKKWSQQKFKNHPRSIVIIEALKKIKM